MDEPQGLSVNASTDREGNAAGGGFEAVDQRLKDWVASLLPDRRISLSVPVGQSAEPLVGLYLLELQPSTPATTPVRRNPLQIRLGYLVTALAEYPEEAHRMLWTLAFAAMETPGFEVEMAPLSAELWQAFGVPPQPSFMLRVPLQYPRPAEPAHLVESAIELHASPMVSLTGMLLGPGDLPIANARVELPALRLFCRTDGQGRFRFAAVPSRDETCRFRIQARGREFAVDAECKAGDPEPLVIHINPGDV